jgi:hypothetical protein
MLQTSNTISPREQFLMEKERENLLTQLEHQKAMKAMELESEKISSKWTVVFKLPLALIKLPIQLLVIIPLAIYAVRGIEPPESLTSFIAR